MSFKGSQAESFSHKAIKRLVFKYITSNCHDIRESSLEKHFGTRRADVYFKLLSGQKVAVEIQNSYITVKEIIDRSSDYTKKGIFVLWILNGKGNAVGSLKDPRDEKSIKISPAEQFLHTFYGGRVYYVNLNQYFHKKTLTPPFALHFSPSNNISANIFKEKFDYYFIRNVNYVPIPSWDIVCAEYKFKIARFYDKNAVSILSNKILKFLQKSRKRKCENCSKKFKLLRRCSLTSDCEFKPYRGKKLIKMISSKFGNTYGNSIIYDSLHKLSIKKPIGISKKLIEDLYQKFF